MLSQFHFKASTPASAVLLFALATLPTCSAKNENRVISVEVTAMAHHAHVRADSATVRRHNGTIAVGSSDAKFSPLEKALESSVPGFKQFKEALKTSADQFNNGKCATSGSIAYYGCGGALISKVCDCPDFPIRICYSPTIGSAFGDMDPERGKAAAAGRCDIHWWIYVALGVIVLCCACGVFVCFRCCRSRKGFDDEGDYDDYSGRFAPGAQHGPPGSQQQQYDPQWDQQQWSQAQQAQWGQPQPQFGQAVQTQQYFQQQAGQSFQAQARIGQQPQWGSQGKF